MSSNLPRTAMHNPQDWIAGLEKGLAVLEAFSDRHPRITITQAGRLCGLTRTAARRYLLTLVHLGYLNTDGKLFWLTPRVLRLGQGYLDSVRLPRIAQPYLQRAAANVLEVVYLSVLDGDDIVYIARNGPNRTMNTGYVLGARVQAQVTAAGLMLLSQRNPQEIELWLREHETKTYTAHTMTNKDQLRAALDTIRFQDWALSEQQLELNFRGIAVPLRDRNGIAVAALSVTMPIGQESSTAAAERILPTLRDTAQSLRNVI